MRKPASSPDAVVAGGGGGTRTPCCSKVGLKRGPWTLEEDEILANYISREGEGKWRTLPKRARLLRCGKSCRLRWMNYLRPSVKRGHIAADEEDLILRLHRLLGNRWSLIAGRIPGRTDNEIKNYWNTHLSKKLVSQGIDPRTHKPLQHTKKHEINNSQKGISSSSPFTNPNPNHSHTIPSDVDSAQTAPLLHIKVNHSSIDPTKTHQNNDHHLDFGSSFPAGTTTMNDNNVVFGESPVSVEEQEVDPNCCTDEVFSSFLNSLINEDMFTCQSQEQLPDHFDGAAQLNSFTAALAFGAAGWGAPPLMTTNAPSSSSDAIHHSPCDDRPR